MRCFDRHLTWILQRCVSSWSWYPMLRRRRRFGSAIPQNELRRSFYVECHQLYFSPQISAGASHAIASVSPCHVACHLYIGTTPGTHGLSLSSLAQVAVSVQRLHSAQNASRWRLICSLPLIWATMPPSETSSLADLVSSSPLESIGPRDVFAPIYPCTCCHSSKVVQLKPQYLHFHFPHRLAGQRDIVGTRRCDADSAPPHVCRFELRCRHLPVFYWLALLCLRCPKNRQALTSVFGPTTHSLPQAEQLGVNCQQQAAGLQESELGGVSLSVLQFSGGSPADAPLGGAAASCCHAMSRAWGRGRVSRSRQHLFLFIPHSNKVRPAPLPRVVFNGSLGSSRSFSAA